MELVCLGDLMVDVLALLPGPLAAGSDTPAPVRFYGGGAAANVAAWSVTAGAAATFVGRAGRDALGQHAVADLSACGVDVRVTTDPVRPTGTCIVLVDPSGERTMIPSAGANDAAADLDALPARADWFYLSGYSLFAAGSRDSALRALATARERGWSIAVDAASAAPLAAVGAGAFLEWLGTEVLLLANEDEARVLSGCAEPGPAARALGDRFGQAVVKRGAAGAVWSDGGDEHAVPAEPVVVVDTTGAGDAFAAGYLTASGAPTQRLGAAAALAARAVTQVGGRPQQPLRT